MAGQGDRPGLGQIVGEIDREGTEQGKQDHGSLEPAALQQGHIGLALVFASTVGGHAGTAPGNGGQGPAKQGQWF